MIGHSGYRALAAALLGSIALLFPASPAYALTGSVAGASAAAEEAIAEAALRFGLPADWIRAVIRAESGGDAAARSPAGAMGLMQLMPRTYAEIQSRYGLGSDPYQARDNILAGSAYLSELHDRYGPVGMLAAYNAGPGRWEDHLRTGRALPDETLRYLEKIAPSVGIATLESSFPGAISAPTRTQAPGLFVSRTAGSSARGSAPAAPSNIPQGARASSAEHTDMLFVAGANTAPQLQAGGTKLAASSARPASAVQSPNHAERAPGPGSTPLPGTLFVQRSSGRSGS